MNRFDFYPGDYMRDTAELTAEEDGIYLRLLMWYYSNETPIPGDRAHMITRASEKKTQWVLHRFFMGSRFDGETVWRHSKVEKEIARAQKQISANRKNGRMGGRPRKLMDLPDSNTQNTGTEETHIKPNGKPNGLKLGNPNGKAPSPSPSPSPSTISNKTPKPPTGTVYSSEFEDDIWKPYPGRNGRKVNKPAAFKAYKESLKRTTHDQIVFAILLFAKTKTAIDGFAPDMHRWLKADPWDDETVSFQGNEKFKTLPKPENNLTPIWED